MAIIFFKYQQTYLNEIFPTHPIKYYQRRNRKYFIHILNISQYYRQRTLFSISKNENKYLWIQLILIQYEVSNDKASWIVNIPFMLPPGSFSYWSFQKHVLYWISHGILFMSPFIQSIKKGEFSRILFLSEQKNL